MTKRTPPAVIQGIVDLFETHTGQQLSESRVWRVETALGDVMAKHGLASLTDLLDALRTEGDGPLTAATIHGLMNHESSFFRDLKIFQMIEQQILPELNRTLPQKRLRIWCAGCSTGQEAYSLAIILKRQEAMWKGWNLSILGTDISPFTIEKAQIGEYQQMDVQRGLAIGDLLRWFDPTDEAWQIRREIRSLVTFRTDNVLRPTAASGIFDLILCRNVMLYFAPELRAKALGAIAKHARPETVLILGAGETTIGTAAVFSPCPTYRGAYRLHARAEPRRLAG
jgi:chemotaxis protein methyltransferase CheR